MSTKCAEDPLTLKMDALKSVNFTERSPSPACLAYTSEKHPRGTLAEINLLRSHRELCDVVLNVGVRKIFAHRYADYIFNCFKKLSF